MSPTRPMNPQPLPIGAGLRTYYRIFRKCEPITQDEFQGDYQGLIVGPFLFRKLFASMLTWGGLGGWTGKQFTGGEGVNIVERNGEKKKVARMRVTGTTASVLDGKPTLTLGYYKKPLAFIQDEIRKYDAHTVIGLTYVNAAPLRWFPLPFALRRKAP
jgi:hypothetical protein